MATMTSEQRERDRQAEEVERQRLLRTTPLRRGEVRTVTTRKGFGESFNPERRLKRAWMRATGKSGRQWRKHRKAMRRAGAR